MKQRKGCGKKYQQGLSLIELMISLVIGLILMAAVVQMFVGSRVTYSMQSELAKLQENARFSVDFISRDLRMAGYWGCKEHDLYENGIANVLNDDDALYSGTDWYKPLSFSNGGAAASESDPPASDSITVKFADTENTCVVDLDDTTAEFFFCSEDHTFTKGDVLVASDCSHMAMFQMTNENNNLNIERIVHSSNDGEGSAQPGNCTKGLGIPVDCASTNGTEYDGWNQGTVIQLLKSYRYFVQDNDFGQPALYRSAISSTAGVAGLSNQEMVEGVESLQIMLGFDTNADDTADCYSNVPADCNASEADVVAVRVSLLMRSLEDNITSTPQSYVLEGEEITPDDNRLRKVFTSTITLRNRVL